MSSAALMSGGLKEGGGEGENGDEGNYRAVIPDSSTLDPISTSNLNFPSTPTTSRPTSTSIDPTTKLLSNRPAPPSPALSRRVSGSRSPSSFSRSRPPSLAISRANSMRMSGVGSDAKRQSLGTQLSQFMAVAGDDIGGTITPTPSNSPLGSPHKLTFTQSPANVQQTTSLSTTHPPTSSPSTIPTSSDSGRIPTPTTTPTPTATFSKPPQSSSTMPPPSPGISRVYIKIRDFGFPSTDERHLGLGTDIPKANRVHRLNRRLGGPDRARARAAAAALDPSSSANTTGPTRPGLGSRRTDSIGSMGSVDSSDAGAEEEEEDDEAWGKGRGGKGWDGFRMGMGRFSWTIGSSNSNIGGNKNYIDNNDNDNNSRGTSSNGTFPSRKDLDMNFMDSSSSSSSDDERRQQGRRGQQEFREHFSADYDDDDDFDETTGNQICGDEDADGEGQEQEPLYPGLYRALYAFEPEGTAEMKLDEDQIVRVVGRGGGVGWAVVVVPNDDDDDDDDERGGGVVRPTLRHALVPEGYLEVVRLDWEDEEELVKDEVDGDGDVETGDA